ncbi:DUF6665 family protein [Sphingomonas sanxanigenens]|uniref:Uncharacterized protein n=1 Tax=Sphingomonas sanxanigenens DSM 19645 = NX02 TaxID=1123269 RepID=W0A7M2_9SPHN|nr:DUF6665 family protein [Sphingomonas sanxanigenens]AHE53091.1 hypothetical protein NX02_06805 [Sphingomonas sanxanigenens DSM 19645 = NX02]
MARAPSHVPGRGAAALGAIEAEVLNEKVESLGRAGRKAQEALARLAAFDGDAGSEAYQALLAAAVDAVWAYSVQSELCGLAGAARIMRDLAVPPAVVARLGIATPR